MIKLLSITQTFSKNEIDKFQSYLRLYYKGESSVFLFVEKIIDHSASIDYKDISVHNLYNSSANTLSFQSFKNLLSELGNLAEEFIAWKQWRSKKEQYNTSRLIANAERGLYNNFKKVEKEVLSYDSNQPIDIFSEYYKTIALFYNYNFQMSESNDTHTDLFQELVNTFKKGVSKIAQSLLVEIRQRERLLEYENWDHEAGFFDLLYENQTDVVQITDLLIRLNGELDNYAYLELLNLLKSNESRPLSHFLKYSILIYCSTYLQGVYKSGNHDRVAELLDLYTYGLENNILTPNESIDVLTYLNVVNVFSKLGTSDQAHEIVKKYNHTVGHKDKDTIKTVANSFIDFNDGKYEKVARALRKIEPNGFELKFKVRWLELKAIIEIQTDNPDIVLIHISNFKRYIKPKKKQIRKQTYEGLQNTLKVLTKVFNRKSSIEINQSISSSNYIFEKKWLFDKIDRIGISI